MNTPAVKLSFSRFLFNLAVDTLGHCFLLSWEARKELNHSKTIPGSSPLLAFSHQSTKSEKTNRLL